MHTMLEQPKNYPHIMRERPVANPSPGLIQDRNFVWGSERNGLRPFTSPMGQALKRDALEVKEAYEFFEEQAATDSTEQEDPLGERRLAYREFRNLLDYMG